MLDFRVQLDLFRGPLDLLLYLVRKHELDVTEIPVAKITAQYFAFPDVPPQRNGEEGGESPDGASTLAEIKSPMVLPHGGEEVEAIDDPREDLVQRLLEYKKYKDAASMLEERSRDWQQHYPRLASDLPPRQVDPSDQPIHEVELWDLVSAMGRILRENQQTRPTAIVYDETPIQVYMQRIHERIVRDKQVTFSEMFEPGMHKSAIVGVFLAILELVRHHSVRAEQNDMHGEIRIVPGEEFDPAKEITAADDYGAKKPVAEDMPLRPR